MKNINPTRPILLIVSIIVLGGVAGAQTWNSNAGGYNTGYGTVYGSFGLAMATQNIYNTMQMNMQRTMMRSAMIKKWGVAAVEKAEREARSGSSGVTRSSSNSTSSSPKIGVPPPRVVRNYGVFRPDATIDTGKTIGDALGETPEEKALLKRIYQATKTAFEAQAASKGWKNNIAGAFTFFIVATSTIYHQSEDPSDETVDALYQAINESLDEIPEFGKMANRDKQGLYNTLIGFAAIPLATYTEGKEGNSAETVETSRKLAGMLMLLVLKIEPEKVRFENGTLKMG
jgi:hypothetical protein